MQLLDDELVTLAPSSPDAERSILGAILQENSMLDQLYGLTEEAFSLDSHRRIFRVVVSMANAGESADLVTVMERLRQRKELEAVGGAAYLASLTDAVVRNWSIERYVSIVRDKAARRTIITVCSNAIARASDQSEENPLDIINRADQELLQITAEDRSAQPSLEAQSQAAFEQMDRQRSGEETFAYDFGIPELDRKIGGLVPAELTVLGGRPGQGKTGLTAQVIARHCPRGVAVHAFELEMTSRQLLYRIWAIVAGVPFHKIRHPDRLSAEEYSRVRGAQREVSHWPLTINDASSLDIGQLVSLARLGKRQNNTRIVIVDYLQKLRFSGRPDHRYLQVTDSAVQLARLAKDEDLALLVLSSVSEKSGSNRNTPPTLQDFRQSGDIAYEAHCALLVHREIDMELDMPKNDGEIIIAKARSDETGCVRIRFNSSSLTFEERNGGMNA